MASKRKKEFGGEGRVCVKGGGRTWSIIQLKYRVMTAGFAFDILSEIATTQELRIATGIENSHCGFFPY